VAEADEMRDLLTYANYAKVGRALGVTKTTVSKWARGEDVNPRRLMQVRDLLRPQPAEEPAPAWAERLLAGMMAVEVKSGLSDAERDRAAALAAAWLATEGPSGRRRRGDGGAGGAASA
jgi:hypothetical protein